MVTLELIYFIMVNSFAMHLPLFKYGGPELIFINLIVRAHMIYNSNSNKNSELLNTNSNFVISLTGLLCIFFW